MTENELAAIEARANENLQVHSEDVLALVAEVRRLEREAVTSIHERARDIESLEFVGARRKAIAAERDAAQKALAEWKKRAEGLQVVVDSAEALRDRARAIGTNIATRPCRCRCHCKRCGGDGFVTRSPGVYDYTTSPCPDCTKPEGA